VINDQVMKANCIYMSNLHVKKISQIF